MYNVSKLQTRNWCYLLRAYCKVQNLETKDGLSKKALFSYMIPGFSISTFVTSLCTRWLALHLEALWLSDEYFVHVWIKIWITSPA
ncbi:uncharacterized protein [Lolium perenne]|uniref:uncharacterized protein isoform X2 n=1 Tax=Lolium perenne TaxID=4522 RepID=UPI003A99CB35